MRRAECGGPRATTTNVVIAALVACLLPDSGAEVCDESHYLKGWGTQRTKQVVPLCQKARRAVLLSGTPSLNQVRAAR